MLNKTELLNVIEKQIEYGKMERANTNNVKLIKFYNGYVDTYETLAKNVPENVNEVNEKRLAIHNYIRLNGNNSYKCGQNCALMYLQVTMEKANK